jgi:hypothetical protein
LTEFLKEHLEALVQTQQLLLARTYMASSAADTADW